MTELSVIMPVYNAAKFLREAIDSVLNQSFSDFEFLIINDGSNDESEQIILSYNDPRIVYKRHDINLGLIATLNEGISLANGKYIARMDNDDVCENIRFEVQLRILREDANAGMICSPVKGITAQGKKRDEWPADSRSRTPEQIYRMLPDENCIAHPSVMIRAGLLKKYWYAENQKGSEDWDLWLRLSRDKVKIVKTREHLLNYRVHTASSTVQFSKRLPAPLKNISTRNRFLFNSLKEARFNFFVLKTIYFSFRDYGYYLKSFAFPLLGRKIKWFFTISPFKAYTQYRKLSSTLEHHKTSRFLFFPYSHLGGAEKVHAMIAEAIAGFAPLVFITGLSEKKGFNTEFPPAAVLLKIQRALYHPFFSGRSRRMIVRKINSQPSPFVFGSNNLFFYELIPSTKDEALVFDLTHDFDYERNRPFAEKFIGGYLRCDHRIFVSSDTLERTRKFYDSIFVDDVFYEKLRLIHNAVAEPLVPRSAKCEKPFRIFYAGRDTPEKRVDIIFSVAGLCQKEQLPVEFIVAGELLNRKIPGNMVYKGAISDPMLLSELYSSSHFVMIASSSEGFPMTLAEGMMHGCIPLSTSVGDIPAHVKDKHSGFLVSETEPGMIADKFVAIVRKILNGDYPLEEISLRCAEHARKEFSVKKFNEAYRSLFSDR